MWINWGDFDPHFSQIRNKIEGRWFIFRGKLMHSDFKTGFFLHLVKAKYG